MRLLTGSAILAALTLPAHAATEAEVLETYADIAEAAFGDALKGAEALERTVEALVAEPSAEALERARAAWRAARVPYLQTEVFRFGNPMVDDWEGRVNAWPLDEGFIDYVDASGTAPSDATDENPSAGLNVIANPVLTLSGAEIDAAEITPALLRGTLHEADGAEANVASGYHAVEFLLWGQDLGPYDATAGERPWTDFARGEACTGGNCDRRGAYLLAATELLVSDLAEMAEAWAEGGAARADALGDPAGVSRILTGMGSLSYGELGGERTQLGLLLNDPEEEQDCFSDNTHNSHFYDGLGIRNVYLGRYVGTDGAVTEGPALSALVAGADPAVDAALRDALDASVMRLTELKVAAEGGMPYDSMLDPANEAGGALVQAVVDSLRDQTREIERAVAALGRDPVTIEGSDSLDAPDAVFE